nr:ribonuclease H-like domain-containing protein [Tanacetum cinerariifolium]
MQPLSSNQKYQRVKAHTRNAKSSLDKGNSMSKSVCSTCQKCLFDANHDLCVVNYLSDVNARAKAKSVKSIKNNEWKTTGLTLQRQMVPADNTSGPAPYRKEKCTLQCALSSKEDKSSYLRALLSTKFSCSFSQHVDQHPVIVDAPRAVDPASSPSSTTIDQDVPSASTSPTNEEIQSQFIRQERSTSTQQRIPGSGEATKASKRGERRDWPQIAASEKVTMSIDLSFNIKVIPQSIHNDDGNPTSSNIKQALCLTRVSGHRKAEHELTTQSGRERERKARTTLLMALPEDHLAKFHKMADAKEMREAIKSRFGGNDESKKMQKYLLKQQFEGFSMSTSLGLHKGYDRSLPSSWSQVALIMRTKPGLDTLSFDDLYNNLGIFDRDVKGTTASSSNIQNVAFVFAENTNTTNDVSTAYSVSSPSVLKSQKEGSSSYTDEVIHSFFANQSSAHQLDYDDLKQINYYDMEEMDLKWHVAMISIRIKKFHKRTKRKLEFDTKDLVGFDKTKVECFNCHKMGYFARDCRARRNQDSRKKDAGYNGNKTRDNGRRLAYQDDSKALVTIDGEDIDWSGHVEEDAQNYAMMAYSSNNSGFDNEVKSCSKECEESYARLKKLYDDQRDKLGDASVEITAYTLTLKKVEAQLLCHQQNQLAYEQKIRFMKINLDDKTDVLAYHKKLLAEALKEKEDLKTKLENWQNSSKNLSRLLNTQMSANDKFGLGYGDYRYGSILSYENEVLQSAFMNKASNLEDTPINDRFADGMHAVPPPMTGNYMLYGPDVEIDYSKFTYGLKQTSADESDSKPSEYAFCESDSSVETSTSMPKPVENASKVVCKPKVWTDDPIIEEHESDSDNNSVSNVKEDKEKPGFAFTGYVKHVKTSRENIKERGTTNHSPKIEKQDRNGHTRKGL